MTYKDIVNRIQDVVNRHYMLQDFGYGDLSDLKTRFENSSGDTQNQANYPYLFLNPATHTRTGAAVTYNFNMIVMDMARGEVSDQPYDNMLTIQSQCQQYIDDVIAELWNGYDDPPQVLWDGLSYNTFNERFQDDVAGMTVNLQIMVPQAINNCVTPFEPISETVVYVFTNSTQSGNDFHQAIRKGPFVPGTQYDFQSNDRIAFWFWQEGAYDYNNQRSPDVINKSTDPTAVRFSTGDRDLIFPIGTKGLYEIKLDLDLRNISGLSLAGDTFVFRAFLGNTLIYSETIPTTLPIDGTIVPFEWVHETLIEEELEQRIRWTLDWIDFAPGQPDGLKVAYRGDLTVNKLFN